MTSMRRGVADRGFTFVELVVVTTILLVLASTAIPMARVVTQRRKEAELRQALREMRTAIDRFKDAVDQGLIATSEVEAGHEGYPPDLDVLVEGVSVVGDATERELRFLRRVPVDPMTGEAEWGLRSYLDEPDARSWGGDSVFDVRSLSEGTALDGSPYRDW
jgi:general secretion pathway protein G